MSHISDQVPPHQEKALRPYLLRAKEFEQKQPLVSYYLKTFVANEAMKQRKKDDAAGTKFLMSLLDHLEAERGRLGAEVTSTDGRTVLTKAALMLFTKADDLERTGGTDLSIVKMFFASSQLFEATVQFTKDGALDPIATEKVKYAKYIAFRMKKALDSGANYISPNEIEAPMEGLGEVQPATSFGQTSTISPVIQQPLAPAPPLQRPLAPAPPLQTQQPPAPTGFPHIPVNDAANPNYQQGAPVYQEPAPAPVYQPVSSPTGALTGSSFAQTTNMPSPETGAPDMDAMITSQKFAKQAVAALQFFDHANARGQLIKALNALDGK